MKLMKYQEKFCCKQNSIFEAYFHFETKFSFLRTKNLKWKKKTNHLWRIYEIFTQHEKPFFSLNKSKCESGFSARAEILRWCTFVTSKQLLEYYFEDINRIILAVLWLLKGYFSYFIDDNYKMNVLQAHNFSTKYVNFALLDCECVRGQAVIDGCCIRM